MIITRTILLRLIAIGFVTVLVQLSFCAQLSFLGASPDLTTLVVIVLGLLGGSLSGAVAGFSIGLFQDTLSQAALGATSLALLTVGYVSGRYRESYGRPTGGSLALLAGGLTLLGSVCFGAIQVMLGVDANVSPLIARDAIVVSLLGMAMVIPVNAAIRWALKPALVDEGPRVSRPAAPQARIRAEEP